MRILLALSLILGGEEGKDRRKPDARERENIHKAIELIRKSCLGDKVADALQKMLDDDKILLDPEESAPTTDVGGPIVLPDRQTGFVPGYVTGTFADPLDFKNRHWRVSEAFDVLSLARILVHEYIHVDQSSALRIAKTLTNWVGAGVTLGGATPPNMKEVPAWEFTLSFFEYLLECLEPELKREMEPIYQINKDLGDLKSGADWQDVPLTEEQKRHRVRRIIRLHKECGTPEYCRELRNKIAFMNLVAREMRDYIREYNDNGYLGALGPKRTDYPDGWEKRLNEVSSFLNDRTGGDPEVLYPDVGEKAKAGLYILDGGPTPPAVDMNRVKVGDGGFGSKIVVGGPGSAVPGSTVKVTLPNGKTLTVTADDDGAFQTPPEEFEGGKEKIRIEQTGKEVPKEDADSWLRKLYGAALSQDGILVTVAGKPKTDHLFEITVENRTDQPWTLDLPRGTRVAIANGQDGTTVEAIHEPVPAHGSRRFTPKTVCAQMGVAPKSGLIGRATLPGPEHRLGASVPSQTELKAALDQEGFCILPPTHATVDFLTRLDRADEGGALEGSPLDKDSTTQWAFWIWQGAGREQFERIVLPQLEKSPAYVKADEEGKNRLKRKFVDVPFERVKRLEEKIDEELKIDYTDAQLKAATAAPGGEESR